MGSLIGVGSAGLVLEAPLLGVPEVVIAPDGFLAKVAHDCPTGAGHLIAPVLFDEPLATLVTLPAKQHNMFTTCHTCNTACKTTEHVCHLPHLLRLGVDPYMHPRRMGMHN